LAQLAICHLALREALLSYMRIKLIKAEGIGPIARLEMCDMGEAVIIAGANGSGKTQLKDAIKAVFQNPLKPRLDIEIETTRPEEKEILGETLRVKVGEANTPLNNHMNTRSRGGTYTSTVIEIGSDRSLQPVKFQPITYDTENPYDEETDLRYYLTTLRDRWNALVNKIFQAAANRDSQIAKFIKETPDENVNRRELLEKKFPDTFMPYQEIFGQLLSGKKLFSIEPKSPRIFEYEIQGTPGIFSFETLSSGEQEVVKVAFDILWKKIRHSIILFDEPELHLHPTLTFRLIETLKKMGDGTNQFIFFTHSADLISTYYSSGNVYFIDTDRTAANQAHKLSELQNDHPDLVELMSQNLGLFAVGKRLVFVEGEDSSIDRLTYHSIAQVFQPELNFIPVGSVGNFALLDRAAQQIARSIFGIDFFLLRDRDGLTDEKVKHLERQGTLKCLKRRHIENYFLDSDVLAKVAQQFFLDQKWHKSDAIAEVLGEIAKETEREALDAAIKDFLSAKSSVDIPNPKRIQTKTTQELRTEFSKSYGRAIDAMKDEFESAGGWEAEFAGMEKEITQSLTDGSWTAKFPGKIIFNRMCSRIGTDPDRVRQAYIQIALTEKPETFEDIKDILSHFGHN